MRVFENTIEDAYKALTPMVFKTGWNFTDHHESVNGERVSFQLRYMRSGTNRLALITVKCSKGEDGYLVILDVIVKQVDCVRRHWAVSDILSKHETEFIVPFNPSAEQVDGMFNFNEVALHYSRMLRTARAIFGATEWDMGNEDSK